MRKLRHRETKSLVQGYTAKEYLNHSYLTSPLYQWRNGITLGRVLSKVTLIAAGWFGTRTWDLDPSMLPPDLT